MARIHMFVLLCKGHFLSFFHPLRIRNTLPCIHCSD